MNNQAKLEILQNIENLLTQKENSKKKQKEYFFLFISQESFEKDMPVEEILRERTFEYLSNQKPIDFWIIPFFQLKNSLIPFKQNQQFFCIITTNQQFFHFLRLRTGFFQRIDFDLQNKVFFLKKEQQNQIQQNQVDGFYFSCDSSFPFFYSLIQPKNQEVLFQQSLRKYLPVYQYLFHTQK
jgi:hypothetical protein